MTINSEAIVSVLAINETPSSDGKSYYYNLAIMDGGEVANLSCTEDVFNLINMLDFAPMKQYKLILTNRFGGKFDSFRITGVKPVNGGSPETGKTETAKTTK